MINAMIPYWLSSRVRSAYGDIVTFFERRRWNREADPLRDNPSAVIPKSGYCYTWVNPKAIPFDGRINCCPFWNRHHTRALGEMESGYCSLLRVGDWNRTADLLWDQVKMCGINELDYEDEDQSPCPLDHTPNAETIAAMEAADRGEGTSYGSVEAMLEAMGIDDPPSADHDIIPPAGPPATATPYPPPSS